MIVLRHASMHLGSAEGNIPCGATCPTIDPTASKRHDPPSLFHPQREGLAASTRCEQLDSDAGHTWQMAFVNRCHVVVVVVVATTLTSLPDRLVHLFALWQPAMFLWSCRKSATFAEKLASN